MRTIFRFIKYTIVVWMLILAYTAYKHGPEKAIHFVLTTMKVCETAYKSLNKETSSNIEENNTEQNLVTTCLDYADQTGTNIKSLYNALSRSKHKLSTCRRIKNNEEVVLHRGGKGIGTYKIKYKNEEGNKYVCISALGSDIIKVPTEEFDDFLDKMKASSEGA